MSNTGNKYKEWILHHRELKPLTNCITTNSEGAVLHKVTYTYQCPYCGELYTCKITNRLNFRKCRWCGEHVSPYQGRVINEVWLKPGEQLPD